MRSPRMLQSTLSAIVIAALAAACGGAATPVPASPTAAPTPTLDPAWTLHESEADGFAIALPTEWRPIELDAKTLDASLEAAVGQSPELKFMLEGQARNLIASGVKFFAFDLGAESIESGMTTNVNIIKIPLGAEVALDFYVDLNLGQLEGLSSVEKPVLHKRVKVMAGDAEQLRYGMTVNTPNGNLTLALTQYLVIVGEDAYVITLTTSADQAEGYSAVFEQIGQSFRVME